MKQMIVATMLSCSLVVQSSYGSSFYGVSDFLNGKAGALSDPYVVSSIWQRCSGLFGALAKILPSSSPDVAELKRVSVFQMENFMAAAVYMLNAKKQNSAEANLNQISKAVPTYVDIYYRRLEKSQITSGSLFDPWLTQEFNLCNAMEEDIGSLLQKRGYR
jgi:hypothetical protein